MIFIKSHTVLLNMAGIEDQGPREIFVGILRGVGIPVAGQNVAIRGIKA